MRRDIDERRPFRGRAEKEVKRREHTEDRPRTTNDQRGPKPRRRLGAGRHCEKIIAGFGSCYWRVASWPLWRASWPHRPLSRDTPALSQNEIRTERRRRRIHKHPHLAPFSREHLDCDERDEPISDSVRDRIRERDR